MSGGGVKRRPPRTAAISLTCPPGRFSEAMKIAREKVKLEDLDIQVLRPRKAATGAILLEIPGPDGGEKATALRSRMAEALKDMEGVKVTRPIQMAELRIKDVLESTDIEEIKEVVSTLGGCKTEEIRTGLVRGSPNGLGTIWVQCPMAAANKVASMGKIKIGWTSSRVELLAPRQLQCFRYLQRGHVQSLCKSAVDRSGLCYRCGEEGHLAKFCQNRPSCILCKEANRPHTHRMGGTACKAPKTSGRQNAGEKKGEGKEMTTPMEVEEVSASTSAERMEVETSPMSTNQPPLEQRTPRDRKGARTPTKEVRSPH